MKCNRCNKECPDAAIFCSHCGKNLRNLPFKARCSNCVEAFKRGDRYCMLCGRSAADYRRRKLLMRLLVALAVLAVAASCVGAYFLWMRPPQSLEKTNMVQAGNIALYAPDKLVDVGGGKMLVTNELLLTPVNGVTREDVKKLVKEYGGELAGEIPLLNQYQARFATDSVQGVRELADLLRQDARVLYVDYHIVVPMAFNAVYPSDALYDDWDSDTPAGNNWHLECVDAPHAWAYADVMSRVDVGVIDSTLDYTHEDILLSAPYVGIMESGSFPTLTSLNQFLRQSAAQGTVMDDLETLMEHGTHVTGVIAALANNAPEGASAGTGVAGAAWNAQPWFLSNWYYELDERGALQRYTSMAALRMQLAQLIGSGCRVVNLSIGAGEPSEPDGWEEGEYDQMARLFTALEGQGHDFLLCKSASNDGRDNYWGDASKDFVNRILTARDVTRAHTLIVGAISPAVLDETRDSEGVRHVLYERAAYSSFGPLVDIFAPGDGIFSTLFDNRYGAMSGTSMATPIVSAAAAMLYGVAPQADYATVKWTLCNHYRDFTRDPFDRWYGVVNLGLAVGHFVQNGPVRQGGAPQVDWTDPGRVTGFVRDAVTRGAIEDFDIRFVSDAAGEAFVALATPEGYEVTLQPGLYTMLATAPGYADETLPGVEIREGENVINITFSGSGYVSGQVRDAVTLAQIDQIDVSFVSDDTGEVRRALTAPGSYNIAVPAGAYTMYVSAPGYTDEVIYGIEITQGETVQNVLLNMAAQSLEAGVIRGHVINALTGQSVPGAHVALYRGVNNLDAAAPDASARCDGGGAYTATVPPGNYTLVASAEGFTPGHAIVIAIPGAVRDNQDCTITPTLYEGEIRVVLTWGATPTDLDSHLVNRARGLHTYYSEKTHYADGARCVELDVDDTSSYGPETTTIYRQQEGAYTFCVHDYSNRERSVSRAMADSGAVVTVYLPGQQPRVFNVPNQNGTEWVVFTLEGASLTPVNAMRYCESPSNVGLGR